MSLHEEGEGGGGSFLTAPRPPQLAPGKVCCCETRKCTIRSQILGGMLGTAGFVLTVVLAMVLAMIFSISASTTHEATSSLELQIRTNALNFSVATAKQIGQRMARRAAQVTTVANALASRMAEPGTVGQQSDPGANDIWLWGGSPAAASHFDVLPGPLEAPGVQTMPPNDPRRANCGGGRACTAADPLLYESYEVSMYSLPKTTALGSATGCRNPTDDKPNVGVDMRTDGCRALADVLAENGGAARRDRDRSAGLDPYFASIKRNLPDIDVVYIGFEASGLMRKYPGSNAYSFVDYPQTYDPRKRPWYLHASNRERAPLTTHTDLGVVGGVVLGQVVVSAPYEDFAAGGWMVTIAQAVYDNSNSNGGAGGGTSIPRLVAVVGADVTISAIQQSILGVSILNGAGYVALVETDGDGDMRNVVAHPGFHAEVARVGGVPNLKGLEPEVVANKTLFDDVFPANFGPAVEAGVADITKRPASQGGQGGGKEYLLAHAPVDRPAKYTVLLFAPQSEALKAVPALREKIGATTTTMTAIVISLTVLTGALVLLLVAYIANSISRPVNSMVAVANSIVSGAAENDYTKNIAKKHMRNLRQVGAPAPNQVQPHQPQHRQRVVRNEMVQLVASFLRMTTGLEHGEDTKKQRVVQPENKFFVKKEHALVMALQRSNTEPWERDGSGSGGGGGGNVAPSAPPL